MEHGELRINRQKSGVLWLTGLSGSGKTTLASALAKRFDQMGIRSYRLDGDILRGGLNRDLGFRREDRRENLRRAGEVAKILADAGLVVVASFISPYQEDREMVRRMFAPDEFIEIYLECPLEKCLKRDPKGLYKKALEGKIPEFTGLTSPYETPRNPELVLPTDQFSVIECVDLTLEYLKRHTFLKHAH